MVRTLTVRTGGGSSFSTGWHTKTIEKAEYGDYNDSKYIDVWFEDFPPTLNMRVYAKENSNGEEFAIGNLFRYANAGISSALEGQGGTKVVKLDDSVEQLIGKNLNVYIHKDGKYSRVLNQCAPTEFQNVVETFSTDDVQYWKDRAEKYFLEYVKPKIDKKSDDIMDTSDSSESDDVPF
tara:strand:- start:845 stop:1381 length:537 start_codon:yes stop_codon:yes gene_type:complete